MRTFTCLLSDNRYSVPTLAFLVTTDVGRAQALARRQMDENPNYRGFELHEGERLVCAEGR